jgi:molybdopterin-guanine dinucleotide biosynthesis protein A
VEFDAIVLAGGRATRLNGVDKAELEIDGMRLIDRVVDSVGNARRTVAVGPKRHVMRAVEWTREQPHGGGPVSAIAAGLALCDSEVTFVAAVDLPWLTPDVVSRIVGALTDDSDGVIATDEEGRDQPLLAAYRAEVLRQALDRIGYLSGVSVNALIAQMALARLPEPDAARDCDTWDDVRRIDGAR